MADKELGLTSTNQLSSEELRERLVHENALRSIREIIGFPAGKNFLKYLFKEFDVGEVPPFGLEGNLLHDKIGSMRAANALFKIVSEADFETAGKLMAQVQKEKYEEILLDSKSRS